MFGELDDRLAVIKRYNILRTLQIQSVAEHVFNVERISIRLLGLMHVDDLQMKWDVMKWAHHHEDFEALHGDFPSMAKPYFDSAAFEKEHADIMTAREPANEFVRIVVKLADLMEMFRFLSMEATLGNQYVTEHVAIEAGKIKEFLRDHSAEFNQRVANAVLDWVFYGQPTKSVRHSKRGK